MNEYLASLQLLTNDEISALRNLAVPRTLDKDEFFIRENTACNEIAFIQEGLMRSFYTDRQGREITYCILFENRFMTPYSSLITGEPTPENIQALMQTELLVVQKNEFMQLTRKSPNWVKLQKHVAEQEYIALEKRVFALQKKDAKQRYLELMENHPEYILNIPLKYLASYLGITVRHLSRIRREINN